MEISNGIAIPLLYFVVRGHCILGCKLWFIFGFFCVAGPIMGG